MKVALSLSLMKRAQTQNFFDDITKPNFVASYFKPNEVKPYRRSTQYLEKLDVLHSKY